MSPVIVAPKPFDTPQFVTKPLLPPLSDYVALLGQVWDSGWLANGGAQHQALEQELREYLQAAHLSLFNNGTLALVVACQALRLQGEVVTSPFTFPATPHVLSWNKVTPVFADIDPQTLCIDPSRVEACLTSQTSAILGVHVYGIPCDVEALQTLATQHRLRVIYDGAHAFGTRVQGRPIASFGDATMFSFHATKLFHTAEGGALAVSDPELKAQVDLLKNFGIKNENEVVMPGINGKMSELQAALGRVVLQQVAAERERRAALKQIYSARLAGTPGVQLLAMPAPVSDSYQYLIVRIGQAAGCARDQLHERMKRFNVITRKYFHPLCSQYSCYRHLASADPRRLPHAHQVASEVLSLPFHGALSHDDAHRICDIVLYCLHQ